MRLVVKPAVALFTGTEIAEKSPFRQDLKKTQQIRVHRISKGLVQKSQTLFLWNGRLQKQPDIIRIFREKPLYRFHFLHDHFRQTFGSSEVIQAFSV